MYTSLLFPFLIPAAHAQLHVLAKSAGLKYFGTATDNNELADAAYQAVLAGGDFGQITPANSQKWDAIEPSNGTFTFADGDAITALAKQNSQLIRCHNTVWYSQLPSWVSGGTWTNEILLEVVKNHITTEMTHYKGQCYAWDVVNEAFNDNGTLRTDVFYNNIGPQYIPIAAAADPDVKLYYNDYNIEYAGVKATAALELVKSLKASSTKTHGVGFQSHFIVRETPSLEDQVSNLESFTALGVEVALTELDIRMTLPSTEALLAQQSTDYANSVGACVATKGCVGVTVWDFDDEYSWISQTFSGQGAACLWDENLNKKPAYYGVIAALGGNSTSNSTTKFRPRSSSQLARLHKEYQGA